MSGDWRTGGAAALAAVLILTPLLGDTGAQSVIPKVEMSVEPFTQEVDASAGPADAVYNCSVFVEGLPLVRYRVNLTAVCRDWVAVCAPNLITLTGGGNNSFTTRVTVPAGISGGISEQVNITAAVSTTGLPLATCTTYAVLSTRQTFGLELSSIAPTLQVTAGKTAAWTFNLKNTGNGRDTFSLSVVNLQSYTGTHWSLKFYRSILSLESGENGSSYINITPPESSKNQTIAFQISAYSREARYECITVEDTLDIALTVVAVPGGGGGDKPNPTPKPTPGPGASALALVAVMAVMYGVLRRK
jgi:hypothetical protein